MQRLKYLRRGLLTGGGLLLCTLLLAGIIPTAADGAALFQATDAPPMQRVSPCRSTIPVLRYVTVDLAQLESSQGIKRHTLTLNLFDDAIYTARITRIEPRPLGHPGEIWYGVLDGVPYSSVTLVIGEGVMSGQIGVPGYRYTINPVQAGIYEISRFELNTGQIAYVPGNSAATLSLPAPSPVNRADDSSQIDVMVVYTSGAKSILERVVGDVDLAIDGAIAHTNQIFSDSGINTHLNLVHVQPVFYLEQPNVDFAADLNNLMGKTDGYMDEVHPLRDLYHADLVVMISGVWFASYTGTAPAPAPLDESKGFSITEACNIQDTTFTHQIGHNLGSANDTANADSLPVNSDGYGYQDPSTGMGDYGDFVTVMGLRTGGECPPIVTANQCSILERFSDPNQSFNGKPTGSATANNVRSINELAVIVANYRVSDGTIPTQTELLLNGGFEIDADQDTLPDFWNGKNLSSGDGITCKAGAAYAGNCALTLAGNGNTSASLTQKISGAGSGQILTLSARVKAKKLAAGAQLRLIVKYPDTSKGKITLSFSVGTYDYTSLSDTLFISQAATSVKVQARYKNPTATGKLTLDAVSLTASGDETR